MGIFHVFQIVQMVPNRAKHNIYSLMSSEIVWNVTIVIVLMVDKSEDW